MSENQARNILEKPFEEKQIKYRPGSFGQTLAYVEAPAFIRRLNEAFDGQWSFEIAHWEVIDQEVMVIGKLTTPEAIKMAFGGSSITKHSETGEVINLVDDFKSAATDALKKSSSLLGVGLHLYESDENQQPKEANPPENNGGEKSNGDSRLTSKQLAAIYAIGKVKGYDKDDIQRMTVQQYNRMPDFLNKSQASLIIQTLQAA